MTDTMRVTTVLSDRANQVELAPIADITTPSIASPTNPLNRTLGLVRCQGAEGLSYPPSRHFRRALRVAIVVDSPNLGRTVEKEMGHSYRVDWVGLMQLGRSLGKVVRAIVVTNAGFPRHLVQRIERVGFECNCGTDSRDCDDRVVVALVRAAASTEIDALLLGSGDHAYVSAMRLARLTTKHLYVVSTTNSCAGALRATAKHVFEIPAKKRLRSGLVAHLAPI